MRGAVLGIAPVLQPVAHSLLQIREEIATLDASLTRDELRDTPHGVASIDFHVRHLAGSLDRLFTYARGEGLNDAQLAALRAESSALGADRDALVSIALAAIDRALDEVRSWSERSDELLSPRSVGRQRLPSTVLGLLFHAAEHAQRHAGQMATTVRILLSRRNA